jgi:hypothetical protein
MESPAHIDRNTHFRKDSSYEHEKEVRAVIWDAEIVSRNMSDALIAARS